MQLPSNPTSTVSTNNSISANNYRSEWRLGDEMQDICRGHQKHVTGPTISTTVTWVTAIINSRFPRICTCLSTSSTVGKACADFGESNVNYGSVRVAGSFQNHEPQHTVLRRDVEVDLIRMAGLLRVEGGMLYRHIFIYMEGSLGVTVCKDSMRRRLRYHSEKKLPRSAELVRMIENLNGLQREGSGMRM